jgi:hypothetical protein
MGGVVALRRRGVTVHGLSFVVLVLLQAERVGSLMVVNVVVFVEVALVGKMAWFVLTPLSSKWLGTGFTLLVLTPVLSRLFAHVLVFEFQARDLKNIWLIDSGCSRHMTGDKGSFSSRDGSKTSELCNRLILLDHNKIKFVLIFYAL